MFIGRITNIGGKSGYGKYGFIEPLGTRYSNGVYFRFDDVVQGSRFLKTLVKTQFERAYVVYDINERDIHPDHKRAKNVALLDEVEIGDVARNLDASQAGKKEIDDLLFRISPEKFLGHNVLDYYERFNLPEIRKLYFDRYAKKWFKESFCKSYTWYLRTFNYNVWDDSICEAIDFENELHEDVISLCINLIKRSFRISEFLKRAPYLIDSDEIVTNLSLEDLSIIQESDGIDTDRLYRRLIDKATKSNILSYVANNCSDQLLLESPGILAHLNDDGLEKRVRLIDWESDPGDKERYFKLLFGIIEANDFPRAAAAIAETTFDHHLILPSAWWPLFTDSVKIRILIYLSSHPSDDLKPQLKRIFQFEAGNDLLRAVVLFISIYYVKNEPEKQQWFVKAHELLQKYILDSFNNKTYVTNALDTLMDKCKTNRPTERAYYCDARPWEKQDGFYCSEGLGHLCERKKCSQYDHLDYTDTLFRRTRALEDQHFQVLLQNINFKPDLSFLGSDGKSSHQNGFEYPFLIAGYINRLIDMEPHMVCSKCNGHFIANYEYAKKITPKISRTIFSCPLCQIAENQEGDLHDTNVYLNYCINCHRVIDSRECKLQDSEGYWLCMHCGASKVFGGKYGVLKCPNCGNMNADELDISGSKRIKCMACGHNSSAKDTWRMFSSSLDIRGILPIVKRALRSE